MTVVPHTSAYAAATLVFQHAVLLSAAGVAHCEPNQLPLRACAVQGAVCKHCGTVLVSAGSSRSQCHNMCCFACCREHAVLQAVTSQVKCGKRTVLCTEQGSCAVLLLLQGCLCDRAVAQPSSSSCQAVCMTSAWPCLLCACCTAVGSCACIAAATAHAPGAVHQVVVELYDITCCTRSTQSHCDCSGCMLLVRLVTLVFCNSAMSCRCTSHVYS